MNFKRPEPSHLPANAWRHLAILIAMSFIAWQASGCSHEPPKRKAPTPPAPISEKKTDKKPEAVADSPGEIPELPPTPVRPPSFGGAGG